LRQIKNNVDEDFHAIVAVHVTDPKQTVPLAVHLVNVPAPMILNSDAAGK
jgi:hypothetical protein